MAGYHLTTPTTTYLNRTPTSTLHRVFHRSLTTIKRMTTILKHLTLPPHHHHHIHQMYLCLMILIRRIPAFHLMMMIHFTHHFQSPPRPNDDSPDEEMQSPPDLPPYPSPPPDYPQPLFPGAQSIPVAPDTVIVPNTVIPPNIDDTPMTHSTKRPPDDPPIPPATEARPSQMPASSSSQFHPSNHLGGDTQPSVTRNATTQPAVVAPSVFKAKKSPKNPRMLLYPMTLMMTSLIQMQVHQDIMVYRYFRHAEMNLSILHLCLRMIRNRTLKINKNQEKKKKKNLKKTQVILFLLVQPTLTRHLITMT